MINRRQFQQVFNNKKSGLGDFDSPLWIPEQRSNRRPSRWFIKVGPVNAGTDFWLWANKNCRGQILCYSSDPDNREEWWGFTHRDDVVWFLLRWA